MPEGKSKFNYAPWLPKAPESNDFPDKYKFHLIKTLEELESILNSYNKVTTMGFDTETTGLNHEDIFIVGYSFCFNGIDTYYVPVNHESYWLGNKALDLIYEKMCNAPIVFMFNMRYDVRVMEWHKFKETMYMIDSSKTYTEEEKIEIKKALLKRQVFSKYDMSKVNTVDVQAIVFDIDTGLKYPSLKKSEEYYLGWRGESFEEALGDKGNFYYLTPEEAYFYAGTDALGTLLLGNKLIKLLPQFKKSGELDIKCLLPLSRFESELTIIDTKMLEGYSKYFDQKIKECQERCWKTAGEEFNLGSPNDNNRILTKLNIHTGVMTTRGMSTSKTAIADCLKTLDKNDPARQFLQDLVDYASLTKQKSSYVDNVLEMCKEVVNHPNRLRFSYKNTEVPSGRFAARWR